jgi:hypothetical protein
MRSATKSNNIRTKSAIILPTVTNTNLTQFKDMVPAALPISQIESTSLNNTVHLPNNNVKVINTQNIQPINNTVQPPQIVNNNNVQTTNQVQHIQPTSNVQMTNTVQHTQVANHVEQIEHTNNNVQHVQPTNNNVQHVQPTNNNVQHVQPTNNVQHIQPTNNVQAVQPINNVQSIQPTNSVQSIQQVENTPASITQNKLFTITAATTYNPTAFMINAYSLYGYVDKSTSFMANAFDMQQNKYPESYFTAVINFGDGTSNTAADITQTPGTSQYIITAQHVYHKLGNYNVTLYLTDNNSTITTSAIAQYTILPKNYQPCQQKDNC